MNYEFKSSEFFRETIIYFQSEDKESLLKIIPSSYTTSLGEAQFYVIEENAYQEIPEKMIWDILMTKAEIFKNYAVTW